MNIKNKNNNKNKNEEQLVQVPVGQAILEGSLSISNGSKGLVLFAHGSGSSRHSPRNKYVAEVLQDAGIATLLIDIPYRLLCKDVTEQFNERFMAYLMHPTIY